MKTENSYARRVLFSFIGCVVIGIGDGFLRAASFGNLPFTVFALSVASLAGWSMGLAQLVMNVAMFIPGVIFERRRINAGTLMNAVFVGFSSDLTVRLTDLLGDEYALLLRIVFLAVGYVVYCLGCAIFLGSDAGCSTYDMMNFILVSHTPLSYRASRVACDVACVVIGSVLCIFVLRVTPTVGIGTLLLAFGTGPAVQFFLTLSGKNNTVSK